MVEPRVIFQTIKLGDTGKIISDAPGTYYTELKDYFGIPLADVLPFHIIGGHITTNVSPDNFSLLAVRLNINKQSIPILIDFKETIAVQNIYSFMSLFYVYLKPTMQGYYFGAGPEEPSKIYYDLENITHLYLVSRGGETNFKQLTSAHSITMTLILSGEPDRPDRNKRKIAPIK